MRMGKTVWAFVDSNGDYPPLQMEDVSLGIIANLNQLLSQKSGSRSSQRRSSIII